ncbi:hypothetical protein [Serratia sp. UGAL515B_01]|uniref:hypothetical protein n=1 Tax=Serratia sp. UGAL515B_01 TaxID=2986763 RepID=UPI002955C1E3|nr:hypothetical protein [Serratia sp. UGAL515B_01]WON76281.1 hypothetical protein OK023_13720 [Serratia sp. UGAL515B_01]
MDHGLLAIQLLDVPNTIFMLLCVCLIMLITPSLAFFYEELLSRRGIVTITSQSFFSMVWAAILCFVVGYSLSFGPTMNGIIGDPFYYAFLNNSYLQTTLIGKPKRVGFLTGAVSGLANHNTCRGLWIHSISSA